MENKKNLGVPVAIVIAGIIIAGAIFFKGDGRAPVATDSVKKPFSVSDLPEIAKKIGLNQKAFTTCLDSGKYEEKVSSQLEEAKALGGRGTPFPIIITPSGETIPLAGAVPFAQLKPILDDILAGNTPKEMVSELPITLPPVNRNDHLFTKTGSTITIIEYSDLECPFCKRFHGTMNEVVESFGEDKITWVYRHFPLNIHPTAPKQAEAVECARELGGNNASKKMISAIFEAH